MNRISFRSVPARSEHLEAVIAAAAVDFQLLDVLVVELEGHEVDAVEQEVVAAGLHLELLARGIGAVDYLGVLCRSRRR